MVPKAKVKSEAPVYMVSENKNLPMPPGMETPTDVTPATATEPED